MFNINYSKITRYVLLLIIGMSFVGYGLLTLSQPKKVLPISDAEIIQKAKDLGLVEPRDLFVEQQSK